MGLNCKLGNNSLAMPYRAVFRRNFWASLQLDGIRYCTEKAEARHRADDLYYNISLLVQHLEISQPTYYKIKTKFAPMMSIELND